MKVTAIKAQVKTDNRVSIFIDGKYTFSLTLDQLLEERLKKNDDLDENQINKLKKLSDEGKLKQRTLEWVMGRPHSIREFKDYLYKKKADKDLIAAWVDEFIEKNYLNDENFAKWFAENRRRKNKSTRAITAELFSKGVSAATIQNVVTELEAEDNNSEASEIEALIKLVNKLRDRPRYQDEQKLKSYLISKGFRYDDIKQALLDN